MRNLRSLHRLASPILPWSRRTHPACLSGVALALIALVGPANGQSGDLRIRVDAFGYRPFDAKVAVLRDPQVGFDASASYVPSAILEVRRIADASVAWSGAPVTWKAGKTHAQSGDRVWWLDFSALVAPGEYVIHDPVAGLSSEVFRVAQGVHRDALRAAVRMYLHQRCGVAKAAPSVAAGWTDGPCHVAVNQDTQCRSVLNPTTASQRDLSGGWHDAGDYNKYVNFADDAVHDLLAAWRSDPSVWTDDVGIPESGDGVPDLLDEIGIELRWMRKMQLADGSVLHKVSVTDFSAASPPSADLGARYYAPATASATISACGAFAHGALALREEGSSSSLLFASELEQAAIAAWAWLGANPGQVPSAYNNQGFVNAAAEDSPDEQTMNRLRAAAYLFALTGDLAVRAWFDANYTSAHLLQWSWASPYEIGYHAAMLHYAALPSATPAVAQAIRAAYTSSVTGGAHLAHAISADDPYRAWLSNGDHTWGSNRTKCHEGLLYAMLVEFGQGTVDGTLLRDTARGYVHYIHGVNPLGLTFLTAMDDAGAPRSLRETYHAWFADGTPFDNADLSAIGPPPGYVTGGVNPSYSPDGAYSGPPISPPQNQPTLKSYRDWNTGWPENSWEVSECHIPYQAAYLNLLSRSARDPFEDLGGGLAGAAGTPRLEGGGSFEAGAPLGLFLSTAKPLAAAALFLAAQSQPISLLGGTLVPNPFVGPLITNTDVGGRVAFVGALPAVTPPGVTLYAQVLVADPGAPQGVAFSNGLRATGS